MRLTDDLAARRALYILPLANAPAAMVIDIPRHFARRGLALGRYYIVILETPHEAAEFETFLAADRPALCPPDLFDRRPSQRDTNAIIFFLFAPPKIGWPWILLCHWPADLAGHVTADPAALARGAYSMDAYESRAALQAALDAHIDALGDRTTVEIVQALDVPPGNA